MAKNVTHDLEIPIYPGFVASKKPEIEEPEPVIKEDIPGSVSIESSSGKSSSKPGFFSRIFKRPARQQQESSLESKQLPMPLSNYKPEEPAKAEPLKKQRIESAALQQGAPKSGALELPEQRKQELKQKVASFDSEITKVNEELEKLNKQLDKSKV